MLVEPRWGLRAGKVPSAPLCSAMPVWVLGSCLETPNTERSSMPLLPPGPKS